MFATLISNLALQIRRRTRALGCVSTSLAAMCIVITSLAAQDTFTAGSGLWSQPNNWSLNRPPMSSDDCVLPANSAVTSDSAGLCANFTLGTGGSLTVTPGYLFLNSSSFTNQGTINVGAGNGIAILSGTTTALSGGGTINLTDPNDRLAGGNSSTLLNVDNAIHGQGYIGLGGIQIINHSLIDANGGVLALQGNGAGVTNTGTIQASNGGNLQLIAGFLAIPFNNTGGTIQALSGSTVTLAGYTYTGGTFTTKGTGTFQIVPANNVILNNLMNNGTYQLINGATTTLQGTITNNGTFQALHGGLQIMGSVTLKGSGTMIGGDSNFIQSACCNPANLILQQPISGGGTIGDSSFTLTNQSTVNANSPTSMLTLTGSPEINAATLEASGGGTLEIRNTVNNNGGAISALNGSTVLLDYSGTVNGGTLTTSGTGSFQTSSGTLDGSTNVVTNAGLFSVASGETLSLKGAISNSGTFALANGSCMAMSAPTTLTGSGTIQMNGNSCLFGWAATNTLTNKSTIEGAGSIGDSNPMGFTNSGTVLANQAAPLTIVSAGSGFLNTGSLIVSAGSTLNINGQMKNLSKGILTGGTFSVAGTMILENAQYTTITANSANLTLTGTTAQILNGLGGPSALASFATNGPKGIFSVQSGQVLSSVVNFTNQGTMTIGVGSGFGVGGTYTQTGGTTTVDGVISAPGGFSLKKGKLFGVGTISGALTAAAAINTGDSVTQPGVLTVSNYVQESTGILIIPIASTIAGAGYGQVASTNSISLAGKLFVKRKSGYVPPIGATFTIMTGSAISGQFAPPVLTINSKEHFQIKYSSTAVTLTVVAGP
jgi:fibronectin-binding autotransporter adhesin